MDKYTEKPFNRALGELLQDRYGDEMGRYTMVEFLDEMQETTGLSQEYIRLMLRGKRPLVLPDIPEAAAKVLEVDAHYFKEYREWWVADQMKKHPDLMVRLYDVARAFAEKA